MNKPLIPGGVPSRRRHGFLRSRRLPRRPAKILVVFALTLPVMLGLVGLVVDSGLLTAHHRHLQNVVDAAATAAAMDIFQGMSVPQADTTARRCVRQENGLGNAQVQLNHPPRQGRHAADNRFVELVVSRPIETFLVHVLGGSAIRQIRARAVAGVEPSTADAAITVLSATTNRQAAGLNFVVGGNVYIEGAVLVNNEGGALDEDREPAGRSGRPPYGIRSTATVTASDIRVAGGVDDPSWYRQSKLKANQLPVEDPLRHLTAPPRVPGIVAKIAWEEWKFPTLTIGLLTVFGGSTSIPESTIGSR